MIKDIQRKELARLIDKFSEGDGIHPTAVLGLHTIKLSAIDMRLPTVYEPSLCVIVQGEKQVLLDDEIYRYVPSEYLVVSVHLPVIGQVTVADQDKPYLCLQLDIDQREVSELMLAAQQPVAASAETERALFVGRMDDTLADSVLRLMRLLETPHDIALLAPMIKREIYYRLLNGAYGSRIAQLAVAGSNMHRVNTVIQSIKENFSKPLRVEDMAALAGMSVSSFHFHFKEVTAMSPLQYQKRLRLMEARRLMVSNALDAAHAAYEVGYESASQFSREYSRMFGQPPMRDVGTLRSA